MIWHSAAIRRYRSPGYADPGFTLRTYTHVMPTADDRARLAMDKALGGEDSGAQLAHETTPEAAN